MNSHDTAPAPAPPAHSVAGARPPRWQLTTPRTNVALAVLGGVLTLLAFKGAHDQNTKRMITFLAGVGGASIFYWLAAWLAIKAPPARSTLWLALAFGALFRVAPLTTDTYLSTDLYRYIWDGRMQAHGINPYRYVPGDLRLVPLRDGAIYPHINRANYAKTVYPPGAQIVFLLTTRLSESVTGMRLTTVFFEGVTVWLLLRLLAAYGLPAQLVLLYLWNPLVIWEFAGGGHQDAFMLACCAWALLMHRRGYEMLTGVALGGAVLMKLFPIILFPALYRRFRWGWRMPLACAATVCAAYLPYMATYSFKGALGFLPMYASEEGLQSGDRFYFLNMLPSGLLLRLGIEPYTVFVALAALAFALAAAWACWMPDTDRRSALRRCACLAAMFVATLSPAIDWYCTWLVLFLPLLPEVLALYWIPSTAFVLYLNWWHANPDEVYMQNSLIFLPAILLWTIPAAIRWHRRRLAGRTVSTALDVPASAGELISDGSFSH